MRYVSAILALVIIAVGSAVAYYFATMEIPVAAGEHGQEDGHGHGGAEEAGHAETGHQDEEDEHHDEAGHEHAVEESGEAAHSETDAPAGNDGHTQDDGHQHESEEHGHEDGAQNAEIDATTAKEHGLELAQAGPVTLQSDLSLPGEVALNENNLVHIVPRLTGVVREVHKNLGDEVTKGELLAIIDSRDLAEVKSSYLAALERRELAQTRFSRESELLAKKITPADDYQAAKQALAEEEINIRSAEQQLSTLGLSAEAIGAIRTGSDRTLTDYSVVSPINGTVIEKHLNVGEFVDGQADAFVLADMSEVWVLVVVYAADLRNVRQGQQVMVRSEDLNLESAGEVAYIGALVGEATRTARATVELPNPDGLWRPGLYVTVNVNQDETPVPVGVPVGAVQPLQDDQVVFVQEGDAFEARPVQLGRSDGRSVEILSGLRSGETYVAKNSFLVKADIEKAGAAHEH